MGKESFDSIYSQVKDPDELFDLVCCANYFAGHNDSNIPVDESRKAFERIKMLLIKGDNNA